MAAANLKILVMGGGIGGLSAAIALRQRGIEVDLAEINREWTVYQVGIIIQANVIRAMKELGLADELVKVGYPYSGFEMQDPAGETLFRFPGPKLAGEDYPSDLGMARPALHDVLIRAARAEGVNVRLGVTFAKIDNRADGVSVTFTDGTTGDYDLMIGADGLYSKVRAAILDADARPHFTGQGVWRYNLPRPAELDHAVMVDGIAGGKAGWVPLTETSMYVIYVGAEPGNPRFPEETLADEFRKRLAPYGGQIPALREQITDPAQVVYRPLEAILMPPPWYRDRVVLIGDAAHGTTPHLGQGAAQAVEDALVLAELLAEGSVDDALPAYMERRFERTKFIWEASLQIGKWEQDHSPDADPGGLTRRMLEVVSAPI
ncbi:FAD-dependent oxidoreductase [Sphingomonas sp. AOB5]|uniref:FAD-dependent oxidoreductase n=1 Tax=Sphingomonas sp. AOB5 TaxID=3034017 RepID=UPI0023FA301F|nr:FAD-dependent oxidoreductase [Sphingomonas sp. AOB5]MDF7776091.1 FAD-dependent oxidoreductase [Sphingomonas sp. AOB5]